MYIKFKKSKASLAIQSCAYTTCFILVVWGLTLTGCQKKQQVVASPDAPITFDKDSIGQRLQELYDKYDVAFHYKWDRNAFEVNVQADPPAPNTILPYLEVLEEIYFKAMEHIAGNNFVKKNTPVNIFLLGSGINYSGLPLVGESFGGQAGNIQPNRLTLGGLDDFWTHILNDSDADFLNMVYQKATFSNPSQGGLVGFVYHEYTHYIDAKFDIPSGFEQPSATEYRRGSSAYVDIDDITGYKWGFFIPYGMQNEHEDMATYVQVMLWKTPEEISKTYLISQASNIKYRLVTTYYKNLGLPLDALRQYLQSDEMKQRLLAIKKKYQQRAGKG